MDCTLNPDELSVPSMVTKIGTQCTSEQQTSAVEYKKQAKDIK